MPFVQLPSDTGNTGKLIEVGNLVTTDGTVGREIINVGGTGPGQIAPVTTSAGLRVDIGGAISVGAAVQVQSTGSNILQVSTGGAAFVSIVTSSGGLPVAVSTLPNVTYSGPFLNVTQGGVNADATFPGSPFYGMQQFGVYSTSLANLNSGQVGAISLTSARALTVNIVTSSGGAASLVASTAVSIIGSTGQTAVVTSSGAMSVTLASGASGGTALVDSTAFTQATGSFTPVGGYYSTGIMPASSEVGVFAMTSGRALQTNLVTSSGLSAIQLSSAGSSLAWLNVSNQTYQQVYGTVTTGTALGAQSAPVYIGGQASTAKLTDAASGSAQGIWLSSGGSQFITIANQLGAVIPATTSAGLLVSASVSFTSSGLITVTMSSGNVGTFPSTGKLYTTFAFNASSSNSLTNLTTAAAILYGWSMGNQAASLSASVKCYNSTSATVGSTTNLLVTIPLPGGTVGAGNNHMLPQGVSFSGGITIVVTANFAATSTGTNHSAGEVVGNVYYI